MAKQGNTAPLPLIKKVEQKVVDEMKKRRSSIVQCHLMLTFRPSLTLNYLRH